MNRFWFQAKSEAANSLHNWERNRLYEATTVERSPGFTERWGTESQTPSTLEEQPPLGWSQCTDNAQPPNLPVLAQFRPAWGVQLALRVAGIEHKVVNSSYAVSEATGPLPRFQDATALVGSTEQIISYLAETKQIHLLKSTNKEALPSDLLGQLITETLVDALKALRYQDNQAWRAVERPKSMAAVHGKWFMGHWHVWAERHTAMASLSTKIHSVEKAKIRAHRTLAYLEQTMRQSPEIYMNEHFSLLGLLLFDFMMNALADSHLVTMLHQYPALCRYSQTVWEQYFDSHGSKIASRNEANQKTNEANAFFILPTLQDIFRSITVPQDALWQSRLQTLASEAAATAVIRTSRQSTRKRVDHAADSAVKKVDSTSNAEAAVAAYQTADQRWMASVLLLAFVAIARTIGHAADTETDTE